VHLSMKALKVKSAHIMALAATVAFLGCAGQSSSTRLKAPEGYRSYVGWVRFVGEFVLYYDRSAFENSRMEHCVSGALPLDRQNEAAEKFDGKRVRVKAKPVPWSLPDPLTLSLNHEGSPITNWCGGEYILFATDITPE
jgi:hypothetical protein